MVEALLPDLSNVLTRWTMGGSAAAVAPADWRRALGAEAVEAELRLLALSGQFLGTLTLGEPSGAVQMRTDIPALTKPPLGDEQRPLTRRLLLALREPSLRQAMICLLDRRGLTLHPGDWLPGANEDGLPEVYSPWQDWVAQAVSQDISVAVDVSAETWHLYGPAARLAAFAALRRHAPTQAAAVLASKIASEPPERRLLFLDVLAVGFSEADAPVCEALANDRAPRVRTRAAALLARLGHGEAGGEDAAELAEFFSVKTKGWLRKSLEITAQALKTPAQHSRRAALMTTLTLGAMAQALELTAEDLVTSWPWGDDSQADHALATMIERSAADTLVLLAAETMTARATISLAGLFPLLPRLPTNRRRLLSQSVLAASNSAFSQALAIAGKDGEIDGLIASSAGKLLLSELADGGEAKRTDLSSELMAIGLLASQKEAMQALERLVGLGLISSDPRLDMLRLNAALIPKGLKP